MSKRSSIIAALSLLLMSSSVFADGGSAQCDKLINIAASNQPLSNDFYQSQLPNIKSCLNQCGTLYSGTDISTCKSNLGSMEFNANLSLATANNDKSSQQQSDKNNNSSNHAATNNTTPVVKAAPAPMITASPLKHIKDNNSIANTGDPNINTNPTIKNNSKQYSIRWD